MTLRPIKMARRAAMLLLAMATLGLILAREAAAGPVILLEAQSGRILYAEDQDHQWYPASITKIMTAYLAFEAIKAGRLTMTDTVTVSENAHAQPPSKLGLPVGEEIPVELALRVLIVKSANDVAVMLAEKIAGSEAAFAQLMNDTARRLGMTRTRFVNPHGLPAPEQVSTARDLARLSRAVLRDFPEHLGYWRESEVRVGKQRLKSHNALLRSFEGTDGIKTGFICDSGFNVIASATRDGRRMIAVVLGEPTARDRNLRAAGLVDHGFETFAWKSAFGGPTLDTLPVDARAEPVQSVRTTVPSWNCNPARRVAARQAARKRAQTAAAQRKAARAGKSANATAIPGNPGAAAAVTGASVPQPKAASAAKATAPATAPKKVPAPASKE